MKVIVCLYWSLSPWTESYYLWVKGKPTFYHWAKYVPSWELYNISHLWKRNIIFLITFREGNLAMRPFASFQSFPQIAAFQKNWNVETSHQRWIYFQETSQLIYEYPLKTNQLRRKWRLLNTSTIHDFMNQKIFLGFQRSLLFPSAAIPGLEVQKSCFRVRLRRFCSAILQ